MAVTSVSIVFTVWVLKLHHCCPHERPVPTWLRCVIRRRLSDPAVLDYPSACWADRQGRRESLVRPLQTVYGRGSGTPTSGVEEFVRLVEKISTAAAEQNVDDGQSATPAVDCAAHGDWGSHPASIGPNCRDTNVYNHDSGPPLPSTVARQPSMVARRLAAMEEMVSQLAALLSKKDQEDGDSQVAADWRRVAAFADRCLFWIFLVITVAYTLTTLVLVPLYLQQ